ncbi:PAS domain-containing sensor histidine kinase [Pseudonocardia alni]|uniref:PAS domain-containing sensor histidine kinase n=1 Tax=Pseudonocardia alni TaxID=33907 RepID=UPI00280BCEE3|nr:ATP-binding protein [Pseudonocardia alni]
MDQVEPQAPELVTGDFVAMMRATTTCVLLHDAATKNILWANPSACRLLGWSLAELRPLKANHMSSTAPQYHRVLGRAWLHEAVERGSNRIEWHYRTRTGRVVPTDAVAVRVELAQGPAILVQFRDIEHEQGLERALRRTTSSIDALARHTSTIALTLDPSGAIRFATDTALELFGMDPGAPLGHLDRYGRLRRDGRPAALDELVGLADPTVPVQLEVPGTRGGPVWLEGTLERLAEPSDDRTDPASGLLMILHDVSGRVLAEAARERAAHRENYLARYTAMGDMAMAIAHELGQPLAAAGNFLDGTRRHTEELVRGGALSAADADRIGYGLGSALRQMGRASAIVAAVRAFVGHLEHTEQVLDLHDVLDDCLWFVGLRADPAGVRVRVERHPGPLRARCERVLTGQVLLNLCFNAVEETADLPPERRELVVTTAVDGDEAVVTVADRGRGIDRDPFAESFSSKEHGSGIGLALSYRIITRQHGRIWAAPRAAGGTRFGFALPLVRDEGISLDGSG